MGMLISAGVFGLMTESASAGNSEASDGSNQLIERLLERSRQNRAYRRVQLENKYCYRLAQSGIGDCADIDKETLKRAMRESERRVREGEPVGDSSSDADASASTSDSDDDDDDEDDESAP